MTMIKQTTLIEWNHRGETNEKHMKDREDDETIWGGDNGIRLALARVKKLGNLNEKRFMKDLKKQLGWTIYMICEKAETHFVDDMWLNVVRVAEKLACVNG